MILDGAQVYGGGYNLLCSRINTDDLGLAVDDDGNPVFGDFTATCQAVLSWTDNEDASEVRDAVMDQAGGSVAY